MQKTPLAARTEMLIRRPVADVFDAFVDARKTSKFWFTSGSGRLEAGKRVQWRWDMYDLNVEVDVKVLEPNERIIVDWSSGEVLTTVEWRFTAYSDDTTFVSITNSGFTGDEQSITQQALDSTEGFTFVLAGLKAYLEHGVQLNLVADRHPGGIPELG
jgi:uncharacterized protein YndB with AHSA1/START domain